ncbi:MAG: flagellar basal body L-ring protein FlgH [Pirellulales bacterium]|nr:flagellar basal body L-ring protein FlgH [Pirellulales bacterium]
MNRIANTRRLIAAAFATLVAGVAAAQDGSLMLRGPDPAQANGLTLQNGSFIYRQLPPGARPRDLEIHDSITVLVDYRVITQSEGNTQARKTSSIQSVLTDWIKFDGKNLKPAEMADGDPAVGGTNNQQYRSQSNMQLRDTMSFRMGVEIVEILPNGSLRVEGSSEVTSNEERWRIELSGTVRRESIQPDRTVGSDAMTDLRVIKRDAGMVRDGYARGWLAVLIDKYKPF